MLPSVTLLNSATVGASTVITNPQKSKLTVGGVEVVLVGASGPSHGDSPHDVWKTGGTSKLTVGGVPVSKAGDLATCNHPLLGTSKISTQ